MDVRQAFADNLRTLCGGQVSISQVCRDLSINRQQFARYLAGRSLPSKANLAKICKYFGVSESDLYSVLGGKSDGASPLTDQGPSSRMVEILNSQSQTRMAAGTYWVDYASPEHPESIVRAVMLVRHEKTCTSFRRVTGRSERKGSYWGRFRGNHEGIVLERRGIFFFTAINSIGLQEPSMLVMRPAPGADFVLIGSATIMGASGAMIMAAAISEAPRNTSLLAAMRKARSFSIDTPDIPVDVIDLLNQEMQRIHAPLPAAIGGMSIN